MDFGRRRSTGGRATTSVVAGSVWESRMKLDEVKGGFKVFNGEDSNSNNNEETVVGPRVKRVGSITSNNASPSPSGKRKTWKSEAFEGFERSPIQIARGLKASGDDHGQSVSADGIKRSPIQAKRAARSEAGPAAARRPRPKAANAAKPNSAAVSAAEEEAEGIGIEVVEKVEIGCGEACGEFGVCEEEEKVGSSNVEAQKCGGDLEENEEGIGEEIEVVDEEEIEVVEVEEKGIEIKEIKAQETNLEGNEELVKEEEIDVVEVEEEKGIEIKEIKTPQISKPDKGVALATTAEKVVVSEVKRVNFERKLEVRNNNNNNNNNKNNKVVYQKQAKSETVSLNVRKQSPVIKRATIHSTFSTSKGSSTKFPSTSASHQHHGFPETHSRLQSFVDLIMWKDISRSVFIFGIGTFTILSSSYTKDLNISFISVISYLGLVYLATVFLFRSIVCRGVIDMDYTSYVVGEEEAIWILKLVLPYLNEFLLKLKALFSGDPATTMKLAALLFVLARCGSSITIWTMAKLGFFGVFTVPKVCSLYSTHVTAYAKFWVRRFRDAWDSCSHKKGVTVAVFLLVWNLSSIIARIWAVFMLFVAFRYYQQNLVADDWMEDGEEGEETWHEPIVDQRQGHGPTIVDYTKQKKRS